MHPTRPTLTLATRLGATAAAAVALFLSPLAAMAATPSQTWQADWSVVDFNTNAIVPGSASGGGAGGTTTVDATLPKSSWVSGSMMLDFNAATGALKSRTDVDAHMGCCGAPTMQALHEFQFQSSNSVSFTDSLSVGAGGWGTLKITIQTNGQLQHNAQINSPPYGFSEVSLSNDLNVSATLEGGGSGSITGHIDSDFKGIADGTFSKSDSQTINDQIVLVVPWTSGTPLAFDFSYNESLSFNMLYLDAESVDFSGINAFGHTLELFASVYDSNGVLMDGVTVTSTEGITYGALAPVPEPSSWLLMAAGVAGLAVWRRRSASASASAT